jgi:hypothetical protein
MGLSKRRFGWTLSLSFGGWGGFYFHRDYTIRLCLGWIALTWIPQDLDDLLRNMGLDGLQAGSILFTTPGRFIGVPGGSWVLRSAGVVHGGELMLTAAPDFESSIGEAGEPTTTTTRAVE